MNTVSRIALASPAGELLWHLSPPGTWPACHPFEARTWADRDQYLGWLAEQSDDFRARLAAGGWELVLLTATVTRLADAGIGGAA